MLPDVCIRSINKLRGFKAAKTKRPCIHAARKVQVMRESNPLKTQTLLLADFRVNHATHGLRVGLQLLSMPSRCWSKWCWL